MSAKLYNGMGQMMNLLDALNENNLLDALVRSVARDRPYTTLLKLSLLAWHLMRRSTFQLKDLSTSSDIAVEKLMRLEEDCMANMRRILGKQCHFRASNTLLMSY